MDSEGGAPPIHASLSPQLMALQASAQLPWARGSTP